MLKSTPGHALTDRVRIMLFVLFEEDNTSGGVHTHGFTGAHITKQ